MVQSDGSIVVVGFARTNLPHDQYAESRLRLARHTANGLLDRRFDGDGQVRFEVPDARASGH